MSGGARPAAEPRWAVGFDLDGTLVDSLEDIRAALNLTLGERGLSPLSAEGVVGLVGDGASWLVARALGLPADHPETTRASERFQLHYLSAPATHTRLMPGAEAALLSLRQLGIPTALCTNKPRAPTLALLGALGLDERFESVVCGDDLSLRKPAPEPILKLCRDLNVAPGQLVFVGDGPQDVLAARRAGSVSVAVLTGFGAHEAVHAAGPTHVLQSLEELPLLLSQLYPTNA